jgi:hypothetical protein
MARERGVDTVEVDILSGAAHDFFSGWGDLGAGPPPLKQGHVQVFFDFGQLRRQAGLADIQLRRRKAHLPRFGNRDDIFKLT